PQECVEDSDNEVNIPDGLEFKAFKPYTSLDTVTPKDIPRRSTHIPKERQMNKCDVVKSVTGFHQQTTLSVGQLGRNMSHVVLTQQIGTDDPVDIKTLIAAKAGTATIKTIRRVVRVANGLLRHGQKALALFIASATPEDMHLLKDAIFHKHQHNTAEDAIEQAAKKRLQKLGNAKNNSHDGVNHNSSGGLL
ncbi:hypothetical protein BGX28_001984, partial [Mortierella sp. GBA30]